MDPLKKQVIIVTGPTASGKTAVAIALARHFNTEIISADSRQCYRELDIGVARPSPEELAAVPHHFIASHSIKQELTAADFEAFALKKAEELFKEHDKIIMVGGTGLYIKAFCEGFDKIPVADPVIRNKISQEYAKNGINWLQQQLKDRDLLFAATGEMQNPHRMMRALEIVEATGRSIISFRKGVKAQRNFSTLKIGLEVNREKLYQNINKRVDEMITKGLVKEVESLLPYRHLKALQTVGYKELFQCFIPEKRLTQKEKDKYYILNATISIEKATILIKQHTRQYAKRQLTWFKKDAEIQWLDPSEPDKILLAAEGG